jgi:hypothetical protein
VSKQDDLSAEHIAWLVESRSENQKLTLKLFLILKDRTKELNDGPYLDEGQALAAVCFSLWRAVFLTDISRYNDDFDDDVQAFLADLILHNTINYPQDRKAREWTFTYYVNNARYRLKAISDDFPELLEPGLIAARISDLPSKDAWSYLHNAAVTAVRNLEIALIGKPISN